MRNIHKSIVQGVAVMIIATTIAIGLRILVFGTCHVPSSSMEPTIYPGDNIIINKLTLGSRFLKNLDSLDQKRPEAMRLPGWGKIHRNDILVFNFPNFRKMKMRLDVFYIKRCVAIPGDTFFIENGIYKVKGCRDVLGYRKAQKELSGMNETDFRPKEFRCPPKDSLHFWTIKDYGPIYVPKKNDTLKITMNNLRVYRNQIRYETGKTVSIRSDSILLDGKLLSYYVFKMNYYFMAGDHVLNSKDSRYWGLLPEDHIIGKAFIIWKSKDPVSGAYRFKRFLKVVD